MNEENRYRHNILFDKYNMEKLDDGVDKMLHEMPNRCITCSLHFHRTKRQDESIFSHCRIRTFLLGICGLI